jgi:ribosome maturation factor RimP
MGFCSPFFICGAGMDLYGVLEPTIVGLGYELVDLEMSNRGRLLRIFIDKPDGVAVEDCVLVSNQVSRVLAVEMDFDYDHLEVSSPGLDRPLKKEADFQRFNGEKAQIKLRVPLNGRKNFVGVLRGAESGVLSLEVDGALLAIELANLDKARLMPSF